MQHKCVTSCAILKNFSAVHVGTTIRYPVYQNGYEAQADELSDETICRAATVAPGRYMNDFVEVVRTGKDKSQKVHLFYEHGSIDARLRQKNYFSSFSDMLKKIHDEMSARQIAPVE